MSQAPDPRAMSDGDLAAHLAQVAGRILVEVRSSGLFSPKALGKAGDQTANQFLCHALREARPDDGLLSEEEKEFWEDANENNNSFAAGQLFELSESETETEKKS